MGSDRVLIRPDTQYYIIKRNIGRVPPGSEVELYNCNNQLSGSLGTFKDKTQNWALRSKTGFIIATSLDIDDLATLIIENEWYAQGPESLLEVLDLFSK